MGTPDRNDDRTSTDRPDERHDKPSTPGSGKQFSQEVHSPEEPGPKGSGKQFSPSDKQRDDDVADEDQRGSGKQFSPEHRDT